MKAVLVLLAALAAVSAHDPSEGVADLRKACDCPAPVVPPFLNDKSKCEFLAQAQLACYHKSNGGCPEPEAKGYDHFQARPAAGPLYQAFYTRGSPEHTEEYISWVRLVFCFALPPQGLLHYIRFFLHSSTINMGVVISQPKTTAVVSSTAVKTSTSSIKITSSSTIKSTSTTASTASITSSSTPVISTTSSVIPVLSSSSSPVISVSSSALASSSAVVASSAVAASATSLSGTQLVLARDAASAFSGYAGFKAYGIPYQVIIVPQSGTTLPALSSADNTTGYYGGIVLLDELSYNYNGTYKSALTPDQYNTIYAYQVQFGVRMVRLNVYPGPDFGVTLAAVNGGGCCNAGVEQYLRINDTSAFPTAGLVAGQNVTTSGLYHYPAQITNSTIAKAFASFDPSSDGSFTTTTTAGIINTFGTRQQMVWFTSWAVEWSATSAYAQHAFVNWVTRGLYVGRRRIYFNTQIDDVHLITDIYYPAGNQFRIRPDDLAAHITWQQNIRSRLPAGSNYTVELGHNGNGDIEAAVGTTTGPTTCSPTEAIEYPEQIDTALEFQKPLGSGSNIWPATPANYTWSLNCAKLDTLANWFTNTANRDSFLHISHTFSHMSLNNATYSDAFKEIQFNQKWLAQVGISNAKYFSKGLIPPAITGLHNGDVIRAWRELGIQFVVGDNTRPVLMSPYSEYWPLITNVSANGYDGLVIMPRWATTIYYNCDTLACTTQEWIVTSGGKGTSDDLLANAKAVNTWHLFGLHQDPFMFHQANLRYTDSASYTVGTQSGKMSLLMLWTEIILQEMYRLTTWPIVTLKHDDIGQMFVNRMTLDKCQPNLTYNLQNGAIVGVTVGANGNTCDTSVPVTFPGTATTTASGTVKEQLGSDPLTIWAKLSGSPVSYTLGAPVSLS